jgi:hypothetical protein
MEYLKGFPVSPDQTRDKTLPPLKDPAPRIQGRLVFFLSFSTQPCFVESVILKTLARKKRKVNSPYYLNQKS